MSKSENTIFKLKGRKGEEELSFYVESSFPDSGDDCVEIKIPEKTEKQKIKISIQIDVSIRLRAIIFIFCVYTNSKFRSTFVIPSHSENVTLIEEAIDFLRSISDEVEVIQ